MFDEQGAVMTYYFVFIHKFYMEFDSKQDSRLALLNLLQLTTYNGIDHGVSISGDDITPITNAFIRNKVCEMPQLQGVIACDMKIICNDIIQPGN